MISPSEYRKRSRKIVSLPSGGEVEIRRLSAADFLAMGEIPLLNLFGDMISGKVSEEIESSSELLSKFSNIVICRGVVSPRIVDKDPGECSDDELSIYEIGLEDFNFLVSEIMKHSSLSEEVAESRSGFREEQKPHSNATRPGEGIRETADGAVKTSD